MAGGVFITGTDTGVGKTMITAAIILSIKARGMSVGGMKPIETGCGRSGGALLPEDGRFIKSVAGMYDRITDITPYCFEAPVAPMIAAQQEHRRIGTETIRRRYQRLSSKYETMVVEGLGGILAPIKKGYFVADMIKAMGLPAIIVASPFLGTLNHTMLTIACARQYGIPVGGVIVNYMYPPEGSLAEKTNPGALKRLIGVPFLGEFPYLCDPSEESIEGAARAHLDIDAIVELIGGR